MLYFIATRGKGEKSWIRRGTAVARSAALAERMVRKEYRIPRSTQVLAAMGGYPNAGKARYAVAGNHLVRRNGKNVLETIPPGRPSQGLLLKTLARKPVHR